jgi:hypothetical protein
MKHSLKAYLRPPVLILVLVAAGCSGGNSENTAIDAAASADSGRSDNGAQSSSDSSVDPSADASSASDTGADADVIDSAVVVPSGRPLFVAQGHQGRTTVSCDDGRTWVADQSDDPNARCFQNGLDCDHQAVTAKGLAFGDGWFFAAFGWGTPGTVFRSQDGIDWSPVLTGNIFGGLAYGGGNLLAGSSSSKVSGNQGASFVDAGESQLSVYNVRRVGFSPVLGGRFVLVGGDGGQQDISLSSDGGATFWKPRTLPSSCGANIGDHGGIATGNGILLVLGADGVACRSTDGGLNFSEASVGQEVLSDLLFDGTRFVVWSRGQRHRSTDGATWVAESTSPSDLAIGPVAISNGGTIVAVNDGWQQWYDNQVFYRSTDGLSFERLNANAYSGSHPVRDIVFGYAPDGVVCPAM